MFILTVSCVCGLITYYCHCRCLLQGLTVGDLCCIVLACPALKSLMIHEGMRLGPAWPLCLEPLLQLRSLEELVLRWDGGIVPDGGDDAQAFGTLSSLCALTGLKKLHISHQDPDQLLPQLAALRNLTDLDFSSRGHEDQAETRDVTGFSSLQSLQHLAYLTWYDGFENVLTLSTISAMCCCSSLVSLQLHCQIISGTASLRQISRLPMLEQLIAYGIEVEAGGASLGAGTLGAGSKPQRLEHLKVDGLSLEALEKLVPWLADGSVGFPGCRVDGILQGGSNPAAIISVSNRLQALAAALGARQQPDGSMSVPCSDMHLALRWDEAPNATAAVSVIATLAQLARNVSSLSLDRWIIDGPLVQKIGAALSHLTRLDFSASTQQANVMSRDAWKALTSLKDLRELCFDGFALDAEAGLPVLSYFMAAPALRVDIYCHSPEIVHMWKLFVPLVNGERQTMSLLGIDFFIRNSAAIEEALFVAGPAAGGFNHNGEDQWEEEGNGRN